MTVDTTKPTKLLLEFITINSLLRHLAVIEIVNKSDRRKRLKLNLYYCEIDGI